MSGEPPEPACWPAHTSSLLCKVTHIPRAKRPGGETEALGGPDRSLHVHPHGCACRPK